MNECKTVGRQLNETTDRLNAAIQEAERLLIASEIGVAAAIPLNAESLLRFGKRSGAWQLTIVFATGEEMRLLSASRELRTAAALRLEDLYNALVERAHVERAAIEFAVAAAELFNRSRSNEGAPIIESADTAADPGR